MLSSVLPFTPAMAAEVTEYCSKHSMGPSGDMMSVWNDTCSEFEDADKMSSPLQGATMKFLAEWIKPQRVLEIGCYTGYSAMAWYEATQATAAEIITLELDGKMIAASRKTFERFQLNDRIKLIEGPAQASLEQLEGSFDLIFVDANKDGYEGYVKTILQRKLLSKKGLILCDNVFARGLTISPEANPTLPDEVRGYWTDCGKALDKFNKYLVSHEQVDVVMLPVYDGLSMIKWKA